MKSFGNRDEESRRGDMVDVKSGLDSIMPLFWYSDKVMKSLGTKWVLPGPVPRLPDLNMGISEHYPGGGLDGIQPSNIMMDGYPG